MFINSLSGLNSCQLHLLRDAAIQTSSLCRTCSEILLDLLPKELLARSAKRWPSAPQAEWRVPFKTALIKLKVQSGGNLVTRAQLTDQVVESLIAISYQRINDVVKKCPRGKLPKDTLNCTRLIRDNLERNPFLKNPLSFAHDLSYLCRLSDSSSIQMPSVDQIHIQTLFLQQLCVSSPVHVDPLDHSFLYLIQLIDLLKHPSLPAQGTGGAASDHTTHSPELSLKLTPDQQTLCRNLIENTNLETVDLTSLMTDLAYISACFGKEMPEKITSRLADSFQNKPNGTRPKESGQIYHSLWLASAPVAYGSCPLLVKNPIVTNAFAFFEAHNCLYGHMDAISELSEACLDCKHPKKNRLRAATWLYKAWWFDRTRKEKNISYTDRLVDWYVHDYLVDKGNWNQERDAVSTWVEAQFRSDFPLLPFSRLRAEQTHFRLHDQHRKDLDGDG